MPKANLLSKPAPLKTFPISTDGNCVLLIFQAKVFSSGQISLSLLHTPHNQSIRKFFRNSSFTNCIFKYIHNSHHLRCYQPDARHLLLGLPSDLRTHLQAQACLSTVESEHSSQSHPLKVKVGTAQSPAVFISSLGWTYEVKSPLCLTLSPTLPLIHSPLTTVSSLLFFRHSRDTDLKASTCSAHSSKALAPNRSNFIPDRTFGNLQRHFWLSDSEEVVLLTVN